MILFSGISIQSENVDEEKYISVEIKGQVEKPGVYSVKLGSTLSDLLDMAILKSDGDTSIYNLQNILYNRQVIVIKQIKDKLISINTADLDELMTLPGIGRSIAERIILYRKEYGAFNYLEELMNVNGIGDGKFSKLKEYICL